MSARFLYEGASPEPGCDEMRGDGAHLLPAPLTAAELAAREASLLTTQRRRSMNARMMAGAAAVAVAVTIPDMSLGAMGTPLMRISMDRSVTELPATLWSPTAGATAPVYAPVIAAEQIAPEAVTVGSLVTYRELGRAIPLEFLATGADRFELAFADIEMPTVESVSLSARIRRHQLVAPRLAEAVRAPMAGLVEVEQLTVSSGFRPALAPAFEGASALDAPTAAYGEVSQRTVSRGFTAPPPSEVAALDTSNLPPSVVLSPAFAPVEQRTVSRGFVAAPIPGFEGTQASRAPRADLVEVQQLTVSRGFRPSPAPGFARRTQALASASASVEPVVQQSISAANESIEAAFAGAIDVSNEARRSIPTVSGRGPQLPEPAAARDAQLVPIPEPGASVSASAAAQAELITKTRLDARVNGVLTGSVDFRQLDGTIAIRLGSVVDVLHERFTPGEIEHLRAGDTIDTFITIAELQAAGIPINYNPVYDEVEFGIDYQDAPYAGKVQVDQIGAPTVGTERTGIDQIIPR
ncbi:hypothetical protein [Erythrobacter sp. KY5]|uniref:hypothetical protein n=1 Tax=Erythrobacter sp. KY5 TaxID=2011159 RepID=UPI0013A6F121|nr:hypothetical protein [Erythrobacter sp. KY5]